MAYDFVKLNETTLVESAADPNLLIEDGGEIKRISANNVTTPQVQSNWNETDINNPAFILNKPENIGGSNVITYTISCGMLMLDETVVTAQSVVDTWNNGSILRIGNDRSSGNVIGIYYSISSGGVNSCNISYCLDSSILQIKI